MQSPPDSHPRDPSSSGELRIAPEDPAQAVRMDTNLLGRLVGIPSEAVQEIEQLLTHYGIIGGFEVAMNSRYQHDYSVTGKIISVNRID